MKRGIFVAALLCIFTLSACGAPSILSIPAPPGEGQIQYVPIDHSIFVTNATVQSWVDAHNESAANAHAVDLWRALTALTNQTFRGTTLADFDTWYTACDIYPVTKDCGQGILHHPTTLMVLAPSSQFTPLATIDGSNVLSSVRYDQEMKNFVDSGYQGESYTSGAGEDRAIADGLSNLPDTAAPAAMMVKPAYELFSATQPAVITYWAGPGLTVQPGSSTSPLVPDSTTWLKVAVIDPTGKATNAQPISFCANTIDSAGNVLSSDTYTAAAGSYPVIPLSRFYTIPVTSDEISVIQRNRAAVRARSEKRRIELGRPPTRAQGCTLSTPPDPVAALVAMHVATAELHNVWTWQTYWWTPNATPLPVSDPRFQYFDYKTAYWQVDTQPTGWRYAFNPYLEAGFGTQVFSTPYWPAQGQPGSAMNLGVTTNCISCHSQAMYTQSASAANDAYYVAHGMQPQAQLPNAILVRNLWSAADRAGHP